MNRDAKANSTRAARRRRQRRHHSTYPFAHAQFSEAQTQQFKETFSLIDKDSDGFISHDDLRSVLISLGQKPTDTQINEMMSEAANAIDFPTFLNLFASKMTVLDSEELLRKAFMCFDEDGDGLIVVSQLRDQLTTMGQRLSDQQVDEIFLQDGLTDSEGCFRYEDAVQLLKMAINYRLSIG